jgi:hypothetical protein
MEIAFGARAVFCREANAHGIIPIISVSFLDGCHRSRYSYKSQHIEVTR